MAPTLRHVVVFTCAVVVLDLHNDASVSKRFDDLKYLIRRVIHNIATSNRQSLVSLLCVGLVDCPMHAMTCVNKQCTCCASAGRPSSGQRAVGNVVQVRVSVMD
jgi:hypothetical protein